MLRRLPQILDALLDGVVVVDEAGRIEHLNTEASRILETSTEAVSGRPIEQVAGAGAFGKAVRGGARGRSGLCRCTRSACRGASRAICSWTPPSRRSAPRTAGSKAPSSASRDLTRGAALREFDRERARVAALGQIAAGIAHEVRNPLGGIRGAAEILGKRATSDRDRAAADLIVREVDRIAALVDDFMVFARRRRSSSRP